MKKTLVIMAAGMGSRYGGGIKQIEPVGKNGEIIIDFSIHDAIEAGFDKIVTIIRKDIEDDFNEVIGDRLKSLCKELDVEWHIAYQDHPLNDPEKFPDGRKKPWGTGDAVLSCKDLVSEPFAVINADDYYGKAAFFQAVELLEEGGYGMIGYRLGNTLSANGAVTRGVCEVDGGILKGIVETSNIIKTESGAEADGKTLPLEVIVSMNFWCLPPGFMGVLEKGFPVFISGMKDPLKDEYLLPTIVGDAVNKGVQVKVLESEDMWFGVTYHEDKEYVVQEFKKLYDKGVYQEELYSDLLKN
ncbi:MAG: nucleotidyltransferase [Oscillospiraceae bacterium]|nr:nucleotidyltransferase [Oscillospiraceae bacterium]